AWRKHGVQDDGSVVMKRNPIVREDRIRRIQIFLILNDQDFNTRFAQPSSEKIELHARTALDFLAARFGDFSLEHEGRRGIRIEAERRRPHHYNSSRYLH